MTNERIRQRFSVKFGQIIISGYREIDNLSEQVDKNESKQMIEQLAEHLAKRPIAPIFEKSNEKNNEVALKFMCLVDFYAAERKLYDAINQHPKLLSQLMQFHSYGSFIYYNYQLNRGVGDCLLQCKFCELTGPIGCIMVHMAINHNAHIGVKMCVYCNREELNAHIHDGTLIKCYKSYMDRYGIVASNIKTSKILINFYRLVKSLADTLGVMITRSDTFGGVGYSRVVQVDRLYGPDFPRTCKVFSHKGTSKKIDIAQLETFFKMVIEFIYGANGIGGKQPQENDTSIIISDDENDDAHSSNISDRCTSFSVSLFLNNQTFFCSSNNQLICTISTNEEHFLQIEIINGRFSSRSFFFLIL